MDAALGPEPVDAAADAELRARPDVALEYFAVVADLLDDAHHPVLGQTELLAEIALDAKRRLISGWFDLSASSTFLEDMPSSSALSMA